MISAGKLDRVITVDRSSETIDSFGVPSITWAPIATLRAQLLRNEAPETVTNSGATESVQIIRTFRTRYAAITDDDRLIYEGAAFDIIDIVEIGRRRGLEIKCRKRGVQ
jgi:head-tail adaptor